MSRHLMAFSLAGAVLLVAGPLSAQQQAPSRDQGAIQLGIRLGYGAPFGKVGRTASEMVDQDLSSGIKGQIPIGVDAGYLFNPNIYVGLLFQYGFGLLASSAETGCNQSGVSCSISDLVFGINAHYHLNPIASFDPWIGLGIAYERLDSSATSTAFGLSVSGSNTGFQYINVQLGGDVSVAPNLAVGPFVSFAAGQYSSRSTQTGSTNVSQDVTNKSFHEWLLFGVRGVFNVRLH